MTSGVVQQTRVLVLTLHVDDWKRMGVSLDDERANAEAAVEDWIQKTLGKQDDDRWREQQ